MHFLRVTSLLVIIFNSLIFPVFSQGFFDQNILAVNAAMSVDKVQPGSEFHIAVLVKIDPEFHINAHKLNEEYLIPTVVKFEPMENVSFGKSVYPEPEMVRFPFSDEPLAVYEHEIIIYTNVELADTHPLGTVEIKGTLNYQACNDQNCFEPDEKEFRMSVDVVAGNELINSINQEIFEKIPQTEQSIQETTAFTTDEQRAKEILEKGLLYAIIAFFLFGLALNLTPCVYPVIPLTIGYFGGQSGKKKGSAFVMALLYVIGIAVIFALLGLISGLAGKQWGFLFQNPWFVVIITTIILAMAASMFGAFEITVPVWIMNSLGKTREGSVGAFIMGLTVGVVIAPCAAGIIIGLVGLVAKLGIVTKGTLLFFIMGLGLGLPYLILATFSGLLTKIPQSGMWMVWVRKLFGVLLIGVALYFFLPQVKHVHDQLGFFFGLLAIFGGLLLGFLDHAPGYTRMFKIGRGIFGILLILYGIFLTNDAIHSKPSAINWVHYQNETMVELTNERKPIFIDFYTDWCAPCKQMDRETFSNEQVVEKAKQFVMVKVDCTVPTSEIRAFMTQFEVTGFPTLVFIDKSSDELNDLREIGFVGAANFLQLMDRAAQ